MEALHVLDPDPIIAINHPMLPQEWKDLLDAIDSELLERQLLS